MIGGGKGPTPVQLDNDEIDMHPIDLDEHNETDVPEMDEPGIDDGAELTAVQRIKAYREGKLPAPMVGRLDSAADKTGGGNSDGDSDSVVDDESAESETDTEENTDALFDDPDNAVEQSRGNAAKNFLSGFPAKAGTKVPRKVLVIGVPAAVVLLGAGLLVPGLGENDKPTGPAATQQAAASHPSSTANVPAVNPDVIIKPAHVEGPEYPISVTPASDAFSGVKGKGWVCSGLDGTVLTITLPGPTAVSEIDVLPGLEGNDPDGSPLWGKHRLVAKVAFGFDYGDPVYADFANKQQLQPTTFTGVITRTITITILYTKDISGKGPGAGTSTPDAPGLPGILGDFGKAGLDPSASAGPSASPDDSSRPPTFAIGAIQIMGHTPN